MCQCPSINCFLMTRQAVMTSSFKDGALQYAPLCMPDQVRVTNTARMTWLLMSKEDKEGMC